jgi:hypothetical protein
MSLEDAAGRAVDVFLGKVPGGVLAEAMEDLEAARIEHIEESMPRCQPIGCDAGHHLAGCPLDESVPAWVLSERERREIIDAAVAEVRLGIAIDRPDERCAMSGDAAPGRPPLDLTGIEARSAVYRNASAGVDNERVRMTAVVSAEDVPDLLDEVYRLRGWRAAP